MDFNKVNLPTGRVIAAAVLMFVTFGYLKMMDHGTEILPLKPFSTFPKQIGEWKGQEQFFSEDIYKAVGVDDSTLIAFQNDKDEPFQLYIGYYRNQREGDLIHSPRNCMPGAGWKITDTRLVDVDVPNDKTIRIVRLDIEKGSERQIVLYWFHSRGRIVNSEYKQKIYMVLDSIFKNRTDDSFVRLIAPAKRTQGADTMDYMKRFIFHLYPILNEFIPE